MRDSSPSNGENTVAYDCISIAPLANEEKRAKLLHSIEMARDAGASTVVICALQADLDAIPTPKVGQEEMDLGSLLRLRAKQQAHHQTELEASKHEISAVQQQIQILTANVTRLQDATKTMEEEHLANMEKIDQAIAKLRPQAVSSSLIGDHAAPAAETTPSKAQVLSEALGNAVNDNTFFTNVLAEHQASIKSFCALVTSAYATCDSRSAGSASVLATADAVMQAGLTSSHDTNPHNFVSYTA